MNFDYGYYYEEEITDALLPVVSTLIAVYLAMIVIGLLLGAVMYVIRSLSLHTIAKRRGINNAWLSWIPVGQEWIIGSLSDQFKYLTAGKNQSRRKILLGLNLTTFVASMISSVISTVQTVAGISEASYGYMTEEEAMMQILLPVMGALVVSVVSMVVGIIAYVFRQMSMYDVYKSCDPKNAVVFLVFGILFGITEPFFLLACRKKDGGMPARKTGIEETSSYSDPSETEETDDYSYEETSADNAGDKNDTEDIDDIFADTEA